MDITLGLDFGTHQSKLCLSYRPSNEIIHEFLEFETLEDAMTPLLPSVIQINEDETISIGYVDRTHCMFVGKGQPKAPIYPKEPNSSFPPQPTASFPVKPEVEPLSWKEKLCSLFTGTDRNKRNYSAWEEQCRQIRSEWDVQYKLWKAQCKKIITTHTQWKNKVDSLKENYERELIKWKESSHIQHYRYFKLASLSSSYDWPTQNIINSDTLCVWYLSFLLLATKEHVEKKLNEVFEESVSVQMGIPISADNEQSNESYDHALRLLVAARELMDLFASSKEILSTNYKELLQKTHIPNGNSNKRAEELGLSVLPEAFAGLQSLTNRKRLSRGRMHLLVDIGGGTTDIAFFTITESLTPNIHVVKSFHKGLNYIFEHFCSDTGMPITEAQAHFLKKPEQFSSAIVLYQKEIKQEIDHIIDIIKKSSYRRAEAHIISESILVDAMSGCPIVYCGGGSMYEKMCIPAKYFTDVRKVDKNTLSIPNLINRNIEEKLFAILATSYGLSIPQFEQPKMTPLSVLFGEIAQKIATAHSITKNTKDYTLDDD